MREYLQPDNISLLAQKTNTHSSTMAKPFLHNFLTPAASAKHRPPDPGSIPAAAPQPRIRARHTKQSPHCSQPEPPTPPPPNPPPDTTSPQHHKAFARRPNASP